MHNVIAAWSRRLIPRTGDQVHAEDYGRERERKRGTVREEGMNALTSHTRIRTLWIQTLVPGSQASCVSDSRELGVRFSMPCEGYLFLLLIPKLTVFAPVSQFVILFGICANISPHSAADADACSPFFPSLLFLILSASSATLSCSQFSRLERREGRCLSRKESDEFILLFRT